MRTVRHSLPALVVASVAMLCLLLLGPVTAVAAGPLGHSAHICTVGGGQDGGHAPVPGRMDCDHCPLCAGLAAQAVLPLAAPRVPLPASIVRVPADLAAAAEPHSPAIGAAPPRGPPA